MRGIRLLLLLVTAPLACEPTGVDEVEMVELTLRLQLAGGRDVGATPGRVFVYADSEPRPRAFAFPEDGEVCVLSTTPVTTCTLTVPRRGPVSLIVSEPDPAVFVRLAAKSPQDTVRDGRYVEFIRWTDCPDQTERGQCVLRPSNNATIEGTFQLMQQVTVYQSGAARMDYITSAALPTLKVPAQANNILDLAGCRRVLNVGAAPCDSVRLVGDAPFHRFTAFVPRTTIVGMFPVAGLETEFVRWDGDCIPASLYAIGVCSLISPQVSGAPILLTARYTWWECAGVVSERNSGNCVLRP